MHWFRSKRIGVTWLALFVLACQFVIAFGHVHLDRINNSSAWADSANDHGHPATAILSAPVKKSSSGLAADLCAVCASINLTGTVFTPTAPAVVAPNSFVLIKSWSFTAAEVASFEHSPFSARGPPRA
jgi:hypothetical protein